MITTNVHALPEPYFRACSEHREPQAGRISVTELLQPVQMRVLTRRHWDVLVEDCSDRIFAFFGTAVHDYLAKYAGAETVAEERMSVEIDGWTVHGTPDALTWDADGGGVLVDWKTTMMRGLRYDKVEWTQQTNLYAHLCRLQGFQVGRLVIKAFLRDWDSAMRGRDAYPTAPIVHIAVPLWGHDEADAFLRDRLALHKQGLEADTYPLCTDEEKWLRNSWAVRKMTNSRATKAGIATKDEAKAIAQSLVKDAQDWRDWFELERVEGEPLRCISYCAVSDYCGQHAGYVARHRLDLERQLAESLVVVGSGKA